MLVPTAQFVVGLLDHHPNGMAGSQQPGQRMLYAAFEIDEMSSGGRTARPVDVTPVE